MKPQFELSLNDQKPDRVEAELTLSLTGNPWTDFGIVSLCEELRMGDPPFLMGQPFVTETEATVALDISNVEVVETWFNEMLKARWNQIYWLSRVGKMLDRSLTYDAAGFVVTDKKMLVTEGDKARIKELFKHKAKNEEPISQMRLNFIGTPQNAQKLKQEKESIVRNFIANWRMPEGKKVCEISGRRSNKLEQVHQVVNPFSNKYHNIKVRGFSRTNSYFEIGPILHFVNLCTTFERYIPYVCNWSAKPDPTTFLLLPEIANLSLLAEVYTRLQMNLKDISDKRELSTSTNLRGIRRASDIYSLAIVLFHNIFYRFTVEAESDQDGWDFAPLGEPDEVRRQVTRWVIIPFSRKQNIRFGNFHIVEVDHRLYDFIRPIPFSDGNDIRIVPDILSCIEFSAPSGANLSAKALAQRITEQCKHDLSKAIATSDTRLMKAAIFNLWKATLKKVKGQAIEFHPRKGARLLRHFIQHFLEVNAVLNEELRDDLRALAHTVGSVFYRDVTLISKLYNISSENAFHSVLSQVMFRLYKVSMGDSAKELYLIKQERIRRILDAISPQNWQEMAETLSTFTSLSAFNAKVSEPKNNGGTQDDT